MRIAAYRQLAEVTSQEQLHRLAKDWRDRFGKFPAAVDNLLLLTEIRLAAAKARIQRVEVRDGKVMLTRRGEFILFGGKFPRLGTVTIEQHLGGDSGVVAQNLSRMIRPFLISVAAAFAFALSPFCCGALAAEHEVVNGIAAIVNGDVITYSQVRELVEPRERMLRAQFQGEELIKQDQGSAFGRR